MSSTISNWGGRILRTLRLMAGVPQAELAWLLETSQPSISRWELGRGAPTVEQLERWLNTCQSRGGAALAAVLDDGLRADLRLYYGGAAEPELIGRLAGQLRRLAGLATASPAQVPYFADVAAGLGEAQETRQVPRARVAIPPEVISRDPSCYALRVVGDSMLPRLQHGDLVVVSPAAALSDGCIVAAFVEPDGDVVKVYHPEPDGARLTPLNPAYPTLTLGGEDGREGRIWGRVVLVQREL